MEEGAGGWIGSVWGRCWLYLSHAMWWCPEGHPDVDRTALVAPVRWGHMKNYSEPGGGDHNTRNVTRKASYIHVCIEHQRLKTAIAMIAICVEGAKCAQDTNSLSCLLKVLYFTP